MREALPDSSACGRESLAKRGERFPRARLQHLHAIANRRAPHSKPAPNTFRIASLQLETRRDESRLLNRSPILAGRSAAFPTALVADSTWPMAVRQRIICGTVVKF